MAKTKATIVIDQEIWKEFKKSAVDKEISISELLEKLIVSYIGKPFPPKESSSRKQAEEASKPSETIQKKRRFPRLSGVL